MTHEAENAAKIIGKYYAPEPTTVDEARGLENFLILSGEFQFTLRVAQRYFIWVCPGIALIDFKEFVGNMLKSRSMTSKIVRRSKTYVVIAVEQHKQSADSRWKQEKTFLGECVGKEKSSTIMRPNLVQRLFIVAIQWRKVDIRGRFINIDVPVRRSENAFRKIGES